MATRVFFEEELDRLRRFPEISREELIRFFTLTDADELFARSHRGPTNVLGVAAQLCTLPWLGFVPDEVHAVPPVAAARLADRLNTPVAELAHLRGRDAHTLDLSMLPGERRRVLAGLGRRLPAQALGRREPERRYPILLALLAQSAVDVLDEVIGLFDQAVSGREGQARRWLDRQLAERAAAGGAAGLGAGRGGRAHRVPGLLHPRRRGAAPLKRNLLAVLISEATNLGLVRMAEASGIPYDVLAWTTEYYGRPVDTLGAAGRRIDPALLGHISPAHTENVNFFGTITVDVDRELATLAADGYRPLRAAALDRTSG
jgi:hypothetical protein